MSSHYPEDDEENLSENERHRRLNAQRTVYPASATPMRTWQPAPVPVRKPEPPLPDPPTQQRTLQMPGFPPMPLPFPQVRFVGLFDTVGSFYLPGNDRNYDFDLSMAPGSARRVVHLTAHHEIRRNFPLSSLVDAQGNLPGNFAEIALPGAHSDVGGGYENPEVNFANYEERVVRRRGGHGLDKRTLRLAQMDAEKRGLAIRVEYPDVIEIERRAIRKELAIYALHQMHHEAQRAEVPLRDLDDAEPDHVIPAELQAIIDAWEAEGKRRKRQWMLDVSRERFAGYIHTSHRENSLPHAPEPSGVRQVYANAPSRSATPAREAQDA